LFGLEVLVNFAVEPQMKCALFPYFEIYLKIVKVHFFKLSHVFPELPKSLAQAQ